ncbi:MAG: SDR family NAD(P)-dependent oxidoreductase [Paracoccaceae bacterium]
MSFSISGKTAIVTGAANGVGLAIARHFASMGANVMFADMDEASLSQEIGEAAAQDDSNVRYFVGDLREKLCQANLMSATIDAFDTVDILINASRQILSTDVLDENDGSLETLLTQNLTAGYRLSQTVARRMISQSRKAGPEAQGDGDAGVIINLSSIAAARMHPDLLAYSVSTAALNQLTRCLAVSLAPHRIRVNAVAFGSVMSTSLRRALLDHDEARDDIISHTPLGRIAAPGELAETVQYLACDAAGFTTGQIITVDGGRRLLDAVRAAAH